MDRSSQSSFYRKLKGDAQACLAAQGLSPKGGSELAWKAATLSSAWLLTYVGMLCLGSLHISLAFCSVLPLAALSAFLLMGVMHDGSHGALSERCRWNRVGAYALAFLGSSPTSWHHEHVVSHHGRTNIYREDTDLDTGGLLRLHPSDPWRPFHRFQHLYAWLLYSCMALKWIWFEDLDDVLCNRFGLPPDQRRRLAIEVLWTRIWHATIFLLVPGWVLGWPAALGLYLMLWSLCGLGTAVTFVVAHTSGVQRFPASSDEALSDWALHQLATTANYGTQSGMLTWLVGGLNFQVEHHLFPSVSHRHYPSLRPIVRRHCASQGVDYLEFPSMWKAIHAHFHHLVTLGRKSTARAKSFDPSLGSRRLLVGHVAQDVDPV